MRFFVDTETCYCGYPGCIERITSTQFLRRQGVTKGTLMEHASRFGGAGGGSSRGENDDGAAMADRALGDVLKYLSAGLANAVNFIRPNRLVITSEVTRFPAFSDALVREVRAKLLAELVKRVRVEMWDQADGHSAEAAGWLALASLYREGWNPRAREQAAAT
jgi:predicted NBD/HSP70 family sugar kinase